MVCFNKKPGVVRLNLIVISVDAQADALSNFQSLLALVGDQISYLDSSARKECLFIANFVTVSHLAKSILRSNPDQSEKQDILLGALYFLGRELCLPSYSFAISWSLTGLK